ncbi:hypothetical protein VKT23_000323 [Stygiomarasmius scandens]|uniref:Uncharacterized protein n=1 Tax=Marasmiellus scandens TaxID=2682957 RepID=A0ABR1K9Q6_9AGAR
MCLNRLPHNLLIALDDTYERLKEAQHEPQVRELYGDFDMLKRRLEQSWIVCKKLPRWGDTLLDHFDTLYELLKEIGDFLTKYNNPNGFFRTVGEDQIDSMVILRYREGLRQWTSNFTAESKRLLVTALDSAIDLWYHEGEQTCISPSLLGRHTTSSPAPPCQRSSAPRQSFSSSFAYANISGTTMNSVGGNQSNVHRHQDNSQHIENNNFYVILCPIGCVIA